MKMLATLATIQVIHRAFRTGNLFMILRYWKNNRTTVETLGYGRAAHFVARCVIAMRTADLRLEYSMPVELELTQAANAIRELERDLSVSPSLVDGLDDEFYLTQSRVDQPTLCLVPCEAAN